MSKTEFGQLPEGRVVERISITGGGLTARIITWGAVIQDLRLSGHTAPLVLGFDSFDHYLNHSPYFGAIAGRYANRIAGGRFDIDGQNFRGEQNYLGKHLLHGGTAGVATRLWTLNDMGQSHVTLSCRAGDGEMGFPGNLDISCTYGLQAEGRLIVRLEAETDAPTLCNLAHHSYFNLEDGGASDARGHELQIDAGAYLPVDAELIPTGFVAPVDGTPFDFRVMRPVLAPAGEAQTAYDHNFCLSAGRTGLRQTVTARAPQSGLEMEVWTTEPGVQFYDGARVGRDVPGLDGVHYGNFAGFCLEPQIWPDSPNRPYFPQALLRPGDRYLQITEYRFQR